MKSLLVKLLFLITLNSYTQDLIYTEKVEHLITLSVTQWTQNNFPNPPVIQPKIYIDYSPLDLRIAGVTRLIGYNTYMIDLNPIYTSQDLERTLIHELVHVKQMFENRLKTHKNWIIWLGQKWSFKTPYGFRPWESEARRLTQIYCD